MGQAGRPSHARLLLLDERSHLRPGLMARSHAIWTTRGSAEPSVRVWIRPRTGPRIPDPGKAVQLSDVHGGWWPVWAPTPPPHHGVRERGRGPNRKEGWWWNGEVDSEGGVGPEIKGQKQENGQRRRRTRAGGREARSVEDGGDGWLVSAGRGARGVRGQRARPSWHAQRRSAIRPARRRRRRPGARARRSCGHGKRPRRSYSCTCACWSPGCRASASRRWCASFVGVGSGPTTPTTTASASRAGMGAGGGGSNGSPTYSSGARLLRTCCSSRAVQRSRSGCRSTTGSCSRRLQRSSCSA